MNFNLVNVIWYDGIDAYVSKFILPCSSDNKKVTTAGMKKCKEYMNGNGEILKFDVLYPVTLENINSFGVYGDNEQKATYDRFSKMYF